MRTMILEISIRAVPGTRAYQGRPMQRWAHRRMDVDGDVSGVSAAVHVVPFYARMDDGRGR